MHEPDIRPDESLDSALGGEVRVIQPKKGYRFSVDAILLARFAAGARVGAAVDLGCGSGVVGLCLLRLGAIDSLLGVDFQPPFVDRATRSACLNGWTVERARFITGDVKSPEGLGRQGFAELVVSNPPYRPAVNCRMSPNLSLAIARNEVEASLAHFTGAAAHLLKAGGRFAAVYPAPRLSNLLDSCKASGLTPARLRLVHARAGDEAVLALLEAVKEGSGEMMVEPPLNLHGARGSVEKYGAEASILLGVPGDRCA